MPKSVKYIGNYAIVIQGTVNLPVGNFVQIAGTYNSITSTNIEADVIKGCQSISSYVTEDICPLGCTDNNYVEYDASAVLDDGSCETLSVSGGIDETNCTALKAATSTACAATPERVCVQRVVFN